MPGAGARVQRAPHSDRARMRRAAHPDRARMRRAAHPDRARMRRAAYSVTATETMRSASPATAPFGPCPRVMASTTSMPSVTSPTTVY